MVEKHPELNNIQLITTIAANHPISRFNEEWDARQRGNSILEDIESPDPHMKSNNDQIPSRGVLKKTSLRQGALIKKSPSKRNLRAGSLKNLDYQNRGEIDEKYSYLASLVPTNGNPTELLACRFQDWRKVLKDLITYFREIQVNYDHRAKILMRITNLMDNNINPPMFLQSGGINDATKMLNAYFKPFINESSKSKEIEKNVIARLVRLRNDLSKKIKEIKNLSGDFKNSIDKEMENTCRAISELEEYLESFNIDPLQVTRKKDPYLSKLAVDHLIKKQIAEENYLHQAYLNLESSGRDLEVIIVSQIHKSFMAFVDILKWEADTTHKVCKELISGPLSMLKDHEWNYFIKDNKNFVDPSLPLRQPQDIIYPGMDDDLVLEICSGKLERKSKFLKSYTTGWYVLSPNYLHEFKSADKSQSPILSLNISEQILVPTSNLVKNSREFVLKSRQTGVICRPNNWVFRCQSRESMLSWYWALKNLIGIFQKEYDEPVRKHIRVSDDIPPEDRYSLTNDEAIYEEKEDLFFLLDSESASRSRKPNKISNRSYQAGRFPSNDMLSDMPGQDLYHSRLSSDGSLISVDDR